MSRWWNPVTWFAARPAPEGEQAGGEASAADEAPPAGGAVKIGTGRKLAYLYPASSISPERYRHLLRYVDQGYLEPYMELLDAVATDLHFGGLLRTRKLAVSGACWEVQPGDKSDLGAEIATEAEAFIRRIPNFQQFRYDAMDAPYRGFAAIDPVWRGERGRWWIVDWRALEARFFRYDGEQLLIETETASNGEPVPKGVFLHVARDKAGAVVRGGFGRGLGRNWIYKGYAEIDTASFLERYGHPFAYASIPPSMKEGSSDVERVKAALRSIMVDQAAIIPAGASITFLEALNKASTVRDVFIAWLEYQNTEAAIGVLGQVLTTMPGPSGLGHGGEAREAGEVRQDIKEHDAGGFDDSFTSQILRPWTAYHYGPDAPVPRFCSLVAKPVDEKAEAERQKVTAERDQILLQMGLPLSKAQLYEENDRRAPEPGAGDALIGGAPAMPAGATDATLHHRDGACPHCGGFFTLSEAEKKKRSLTRLTR